ncbi:MerR family transcriptional regulator [Gordonia sp. TBRC 11910]|uniref:MerR family transcriptional regulator n=1 Tax=Gordonia asplenii TaxID=2725283 RepID=A0A848L3Y4_9ACTN|nr:MerR family transcriptional regulator [Gordonia asplenii]NMO05257.1 MerR family transcriptional regulator [Gordonia asplenii]
MQISELASTTGHTVATVKFYLRSGLLPAGERTSATRAVYDDSHVQRLRLIRALTDIGGLSLAQVRAVLDTLDDDAPSPSHVLGAAYLAFADRAPTRSDGRVRRILVDLGWSPHEKDPYLAHIEEIVATLDDLDVPISDDALRVYADAAMRVATVDIDRTDTDDLSRGLTVMATGTILYEPILAGLRRLAHAQIITARFDAAPAGSGADHDKMAR